MKDTGYTFAGGGNIISETFLHRLFFGESKYLPPIIGTLSTMPVKKSGLGLQYPVTPASEKYLSFLRTRSKLIGYVTGERSFSTDGHLMVFREERHDGPKIRDGSKGAKLKGLVDDLEAPERRLILCANNTGLWLTVQDTTVTSTVLAATEFRLSCARYDVTPPNLQKK